MQMSSMHIASPFWPDKNRQRHRRKLHVYYAKRASNGVLDESASLEYIASDCSINDLSCCILDLPDRLDIESHLRVDMEDVVSIRRPAYLPESSGPQSYS